MIIMTILKLAEGTILIIVQSVRDLHAHGRGHHGGSVRERELRVPGLVLIELVQPLAEKIYGVRQDHDGARIDISLLDQLLDPVIGLVLYPSVDVLPGSLRIVPVIQGLDPSVVIALDQVEERLEKWIILCGPDLVGRS